MGLFHTSGAQVDEAVRPRIVLLTWAVVGIAMILATTWMALAGLALEWRSAVPAAGACATCGGLAIFYRFWRPAPRLSATLTAVAQLVALSAAAGPLSYAVAVRGGPLWDATFSAWDRSLGFDWVAYAVSMDGHPRLAWAGGLAYDSLKLQFLVVPIVLGFTGRLRALAEFVAAFAIAALAVVLVSGAMPALGVYPGLGIPPGRFPNVAPRDVYDTAAIMSALRRGGFGALALGDVYGIITFPSFHAAGGVLTAAALWRVPKLRWPACAFNGLMIASTPTHGGHYAVDVLAGAAAALIAVAVARVAVGNSGPSFIRASALSETPSTPRPFDDKLLGEA